MKLRPRIKTEVLDIEFVEVVSQDVHQLCTACLCATRTTRTLDDDDALKQYYMSFIIHETQVLDPRVSVRLCWECVAQLRSSLQLRERATLSYSTLLTLLDDPDKESFNKLFNPESMRSERLQTCLAHCIDIPPEDDHKPATGDQCGDGDSDGDDAAEQLPTVKEEIDPETEDNKDWYKPKTGLEIPNKLNQVDEHEDNAETEPMKKCDTLHTGDEPSETENTPDTLTPATQGNTLYKCTVCPKICKTKAGLTSHAKLHTSAARRSFTCDLCLRTFTQKRYIQKHMKRHVKLNHSTETTSFPQCQHCQTYYSSASLSSHVCKKKKIKENKERIQEVYECNVCSKSFISNCKLVRHKKSHTRPFHCHLCPKTFGQKVGLDCHLMTHPGVAKRFMCSVCAKGFAERRRMEWHMVRYHPLGCSKELIASAARRGLQLRSKKLEKTLKCEMCPKKFLTPRLLKEHTRRHTEPPIQCDTCLKSYKNEKALKNHTCSDSGVPLPYQCEVCLKSFKLKYRLTYHLRGHGIGLGDVSFMCEVCSKTFTTKSSLERHTVGHTKTREKPYQCDECPKVFAEKNQLLRHKWRHTGERPFKCSVCPSAFYAKRNMMKHFFLHTKNRLTCQVCNKIFRYKSYLRAHMRVHTGEKPAVCEVCQKGFYSKRDLIKHMSTRHGMDGPSTRTHAEALATTERSRDSSVASAGT